MQSTVEHCPGGKVLLPLPPGVRGDAVLGGTNREYCYELSRTWDDALPTLLFVMMNPSTALPWFDDPTVAKCRRYAIGWGFGTLLVGNTFAYRATAQERLMEVADPVGPDNDAHLLSMADRAACQTAGSPAKMEASLQRSTVAIFHAIAKMVREAGCQLEIEVE